MKINTLVVQIPAFNEEKTIGTVIKSIPRKIDGVNKVLVLVIDDGSSDNTKIVSEKSGADFILSHSSNMGLGITFRDGINQALKMGADVVVNIDADGQFDSNDIKKLIVPIQENKAEMVTCSRFANEELVPKMPFIKYIGNKIFVKILNVLTSKNFTDTQCGFRAYSKECCLRMNLFGRFTYTHEVILDLANKGLTIVEIPCKVEAQRKGKSRIVKHWWHYSLNSLLIIGRAIRDYRPLLFFGTIGLFFASIGFVSLFFMLVTWIITGKTSPYTSLIGVGGTIFLFGFLILILAFLADLIGRQRKLQEEILYYQKLNNLKK